MAALVFWPTPAQAMHISEGILPLGWAGLWFLVAAPFLYWGLRTINRRRAADPVYMTMVALVGSAVFVISCMPVPIPWSAPARIPAARAWGPADRPGPDGRRGQHRPAAPGPVSGPRRIDDAGGEHRLDGRGRGLQRLTASFACCGGAGCRCLPRLWRPAWSPTGPPTPRPRSNCPARLHGDGSLWAMFATVVVAFVPTQLPLGIAEGIVTAVGLSFRAGSVVRSCWRLLPQAACRRRRRDDETTSARC